ncbi:DivIVA domain-containing protein [Thermosediminibacter oceani]|uniref:DivIVA domain protein n=1 Tax=Thermosediminibacter oceani (strain ATCC BAA-1034 / DSM 16646 / JW/IW-1228P) TaxID=555079 RepID=D9S2Z4_THEOJ|nr:DivIVA domain-containing protein [Thermosediminibacter oceani]ADL07771.1 DivIVA domain protein [Thermosediminibacter oceani DSM 16646]
MILTPLDIQKKEFRKSFRGYSEDEVKDFLEKVTQSYEKIYRENQDLKEEVKFLKEKLQGYQEMESTLKKAIILAEKAAEDLRKNAEREKELILKSARSKAMEMMGRAEARYNAINDQYEEVKRQFMLFKTRFLNFLQSQIDLINAIVIEEEDLEKQPDKAEEYIEQAAAGRDFENEETEEEGTIRDKVAKLRSDAENDDRGKETVGSGDNSV